MVCVSFYVICIVELLVSNVICRFSGLVLFTWVFFILFIHHNIHIYFELCTYCKIWDIYLLWNMWSFKNGGAPVILASRIGEHTTVQNKSTPTDVNLRKLTIKFFQLWRSPHHSCLPHGREQQIIEQPALPAGRMYSLPTVGLEYIMSIAINSLLLYWFQVTPMSLSSHYSYKSPVYFKSKLYSALVDFFHI